MKALVIASLLFFSLRAMSATEGENQKSECIYADQSGREAKEQLPTESAPAQESSQDGQSV